MAIYVGNSHPTGGTDVYIGSFTPNIYIGSFLTYPEANIRYVFRNGALHYSSGSNLYASGSNYAWYAADVLMYNGSTFVSSAANVTLTATRISGDTAFHINANNEVYADDRTNVTGSTRTATFRASYGDTTAATFTVTQAANQKYSAQETLGLTAYTTNNYYYGGGDYFIPCERRFASWDYYSSGYRTSTANTTQLVTAMTYDIDYQTCNWMSSAATEGVGWPRKLVMDHNYASGPSGNRSATITVMYPVNGSWSDYNYVTASTTITQFGANYSSFEYRINSITPRQTTWAGNVSGTAYTANVEVEAQYRQTTNYGVTGTTGWTTTTGNWITYTGRPDMCGNQKPMGTTNGYYFYYLENGENTGAPYGELYYPTTSTTYGTIGVYPTQTNGSSSDKTQQMDIVFGDATSSFTLTQLGNVYYQLSPDSLSFPASGGTSALTVSASSTGWGVSASTNWLTIGTSGNTVNVTASTNVGQATQARNGAVSIYHNGTVYDTTSVSQVADNYVFTALSVTAITLAATATSYSNLAVQSFAGYTPVPISNSDISITNNNMNLGINGSVTSAGTGVYYVPLTCSTNTSTTTPKHATLTITQPGSGKQIVYSFTQTVADGTPAGVTKIADLGNGWILGTVWIANAGTSPNYEPVNMIVIVRKDATVSRTITLYGDYVTFPPPNHQRNVVTISPNPKTYSYSAGATFQLTSLDPSMPGTYTFHGINTTLTGVNANVSLYTSPTPPEGMMYITIQ